MSQICYYIKESQLLTGGEYVVTVLE